MRNESHFRPSRTRTALALAAVACSAATAWAGNGTYSSGEFDFCVSVRFRATPDQIARIESRFLAASQVLADATDGQHRFGKVTIVNDSGASQTAEYWIHPGDGGAYATRDGYGVRGQHVNMWWDRHFAPDGAEITTEHAYTIAHEFAHQAYGALDEYKGPSGAAECAPTPDTATLNFCLMDNYKSRGGQSGGGSTHTLNEFCTASNHDPDMDTDQDSYYGESCWETIAAHPKRPATAPAGLPVSAPPAAHTIETALGFGGARAMLVLDRSGSMSLEERLVYAKEGAKLFVDVFQANDSLGVASFSSSATVNFALTEITGDAVRAAAKATIDALSASGSTNIGGGLSSALSQITGQAQRSCNELVVLLSDGDHNTGTPPGTVLPMLQAEGVTVFSVGLGSGISTTGQATLSDLAAETGGKYYWVASASDLPGLFLLLAAESSGTGLLLAEPQDLAAGEAVERAVLVEEGAQRARFALTLTQEDPAVELALRTPSGMTIEAADASALPDVAYLEATNSRIFEVTSPLPGDWTLVATAGPAMGAQVELLGFAHQDGVQLLLSTPGAMLTWPDPIVVRATPTFGGENVVGATVVGRVVRPDGTPVPLELHDDGQPASGDDTADDGVYTGRFSDYDGDGSYRVEVEAVNAFGTTYIGEEFDVEPGDAPSPVPSFQRAASASIVVSGVPKNRPPDCGPASQATVELWPPNHRFQSVDVLAATGIVDPDGDPLTITIDAITQDEPVDGPGSGHTAPDGRGVGTGVADLRAERTGGGNGRVYHVAFTASDPLGASCKATLVVTVPHDKGGAAAVDDGQAYDSTQP